MGRIAKLPAIEPMDHEEFKAWLDALGVSQNTAAGILGVSRSTVVRYLRGPDAHNGLVIPGHVTVTCRLLLNLFAVHGQLAEADGHLDRKAIADLLETAGVPVRTAQKAA